MDSGTSQEGDAGAPCLPVSGPGAPIATGLATPRRLAADDSFLYIGIRGSLTASDGRVIRVPLMGGSTSEVARGFHSPDAIAAAGGKLFVLDDKGLWRVDAASGTQTQINSSLNNALFGESALLIDGTAVVVATGFRDLVRVEQDGSGSKNLYVAPAGAAVHGLARSGGDLYFLVAHGTEPGIWRVPIDGSAPASRVRPEPENGHALIIDGDRFVWSEGENGAGRIVSAPMAGGEATPLSDHLSHPFQIVRFNGALYFKDTTEAPSKDFLRGIGSCGVSTVGPEGIGPGDLIEAAGILFFSSEDPSAQGYVSRLP